MRAPSHLGLAVAYRRIGVVVLKEGALRHWQIAKAAYDSLDKLTELVNGLIDAHDPTVVVLERTGEACRKGAAVQRRIAVIADIAQAHELIVMTVPRHHVFKNKYEEAEALATRYPDLKSWVPKPVPCWENEPRRLILFEALAMADGVMRGAAME